jgi:hypothetical protein
MNCALLASEIKARTPPLKGVKDGAPAAIQEGFFASARALSASARNDDVGGFCATIALLELALYERQSGKKNFAA